MPSYEDRVAEEQARLAAKEALYIPPTDWEEFKRSRDERAAWLAEWQPQTQPQGADWFPLKLIAGVCFRPLGLLMLLLWALGGLADRKQFRDEVREALKP